MKGLLLGFCFLALLMCLPRVATPSQSKRKQPAAQKPTKPIPIPCGIKQTVQEFVEESSIEWRHAAETDDEEFYYNTRRMRCDDQGVLKVWIKSIPKPKISKYPLDHSLQRYEFKCTLDQMRKVSETSYDLAGRVLDSETIDNAKWQDVLPHSVGESMLNTVCNKGM